MRPLISILGLFLLLAGCQPLSSAGPYITIEWTTESEVDVAGFNLYRSETPSGPFRQINSALIPGSNDAVSGGRYSYLDSLVEPGRTYYYRLEDVDLDGARTMHGPIRVEAPVVWHAGWAIAAVAGLSVAALLAWRLRTRRPKDIS